MKKVVFFVAWVLFASPIFAAGTVQNHQITAPAQDPIAVVEQKVEKLTQSKKFEKIQKKLDKKAQKAGGKSWMVSWLLALFLGGLGIHRFYLGYTWQGVVQLLTGGGLFIWAFIDFIRILIRDLKPNGGDYTD